MTYKNIIFQVENGLATITFNRPKALNALNVGLFEELSQALDHIEDDEDIRVLILTGAGDKAFVAGADITELAKFTPIQTKHFSAMGQRIIGKLQDISIPVIGAVNGFALGGGNEVALACDFIYASENAKFGMPEINLGLIPGFGGTQRLPRLVGKNLAKELMFTGKMISAQEALEMGMVNRICKPETLMGDAKETAEMIASKGRVALQAAKQVINRGLDADMQTGCLLENDAFAVCMSSEDGKEGTAAFIEKRKPVFIGSRK
jgi:enoyl-CoA hydratase